MYFRPLVTLSMGNWTSPDDADIRYCIGVLVSKKIWPVLHFQTIWPDNFWSFDGSAWRLVEMFS